MGGRGSILKSAISDVALLSRESEVPVVGSAGRAGVSIRGSCVGSAGWQADKRTTSNIGSIFKLTRLHSMNKLYIEIEVDYYFKLTKILKNPGIFHKSSSLGIIRVLREGIINGNTSSNRYS
jgi:hypothetical protein